MYSKYTSMVIVALIYVFALFVGVIVFRITPEMTLIMRVFLGNVSATVVIYLFSLIMDNASLYDPYWSVQPPIILMLVFTHLNVQWTLPMFILFVSIMIWSVRLTYNWARGWVGFHDQDWRYTMLKHKAPKIYPLTNLFGIQMMPTCLVFAQLYGAILFIQSNPSFNLLLILGSMMMILAAVIQYIADEQMKTFKRNHQGQRDCIDEGLWRISRHPNYFGEVMVWWGLYIIYLSSAMRLDFVIIAPILMTSLFIFISIPMMERKILSSRPEYQIYQEQVSMLFPWFRKTPLQETSKESS
jgi:steroid 5-alpha reductase family enzyme